MEARSTNGVKRALPSLASVGEPRYSASRGRIMNLTFKSPCSAARARLNITPAYWLGTTTVTGANRSVCFLISRFSVRPRGRLPSTITSSAQVYSFSIQTGPSSGWFRKYEIKGAKLVYSPSRRRCLSNPIRPHVVGRL